MMISDNMFFPSTNSLRLMDHAPLTAFLSKAVLEELYMSLIQLDSLASQSPQALGQITARMIRN